MAGMASAWNLVGGYAGYLDRTMSLSWGLAPTLQHIVFKTNQPASWHFLGGGMAMQLAFLLGILTIRLRGPFFTLSPLPIAEILLLLATRFVDLTGGSQGLDIPYKPSLFNFVFQKLLCILRDLIGASRLLSRWSPISTTARRAVT